MVNIFANLTWVDFAIGVIVPIFLAAAVVVFLIVQMVRTLVKYFRGRREK